MVCKYWRQEDLFCVKKEETVNPDEFSDCAETCPDYEPTREHEIVITCCSCDTKFPLKRAKEIVVNNKEYLKCPACGAVQGFKRDDEELSESSN